MRDTERNSTNSVSTNGFAHDSWTNPGFCSRQLEQFVCVGLLILTEQIRNDNHQGCRPQKNAMVFFQPGVSIISHPRSLPSRPDQTVASRQCTLQVGHTDALHVLLCNIPMHCIYPPSSRNPWTDIGNHACQTFFYERFLWDDGILEVHFQI